MSALLNSTATCKSCGEQIAFTTVRERGRNEATGWSDGMFNGLVCWSARDFQHVPDTHSINENRRHV